MSERVSEMEMIREGIRCSLARRSKGSRCSSFKVRDGCTDAVCVKNGVTDLGCSSLVKWDVHKISDVLGNQRDTGNENFFLLLFGSLGMVKSCKDGAGDRKETVHTCGNGFSASCE